jgi:hypothetical protein
VGAFGVLISEVQRFLNQAIQIDGAMLTAAAARVLQHALDDAVGAASGQRGWIYSA